MARGFPLTSLPLSAFLSSRVGIPCPSRGLGGLRVTVAICPGALANAIAFACGLVAHFLTSRSSVKPPTPHRAAACLDSLPPFPP